MSVDFMHWRVILLHTVRFNIFINLNFGDLFLDKYLLKKNAVFD